MLFSVIFALRRVLLLRSDIRLTPSDIRFASLGGEYNITAERSGAISLSLATISRWQSQHITKNFSTLKFFKILQMHFGYFGSVDRFEPAKCIFWYRFPTAPKLWIDSNRHNVGDDLPGVPNKSAQTGRRGRRPLQFKLYLQSHRCKGVLYRFELANRLKCLKNSGIINKKERWWIYGYGKQIE